VSGVAVEGEVVDAELDTLAGALLAVQREAPALHKDATAVVPTKSGGKYSYSYISLGSVMDQVLPLLNKHGLVLMQFPCALEGRPALRTRLVHAASGESVEDTMLLAVEQTDPQGQGSAITYARRYSLMAALGLVADEDDDGNTASRPREPPPASPQREAFAKALKKLENDYPREAPLTPWPDEIQGWAVRQEFPSASAEWTGEHYEAATRELERWHEGEGVPF
jgi:ERF superfamily